MADRRFEDKVSVEDLLKKPVKEILIMTYVQTVKTNGQVAENCDTITKLQEEIKDKIGIEELNRMQKIFAWVTGSIAFILIVFNVFDRVINWGG